MKSSSRNNSSHRRQTLRFWLALGLLLSPAAAQEVFREFGFNGGAEPTAHFSELDPGAKRGNVTRPRHVPKPIALDLEHATRAEFSVEYWGGHIGTTGQRFQINGQGWCDLPQPAGTPEAPQRYHRVLHGNNAVPIPLAHLRHGDNTVQFAAGPQLKGNWGFYWIYDFTVRVFYDPARAHPTGEVTAPRPGATFGDSLELEARAASPNGAITRVEFIGEYDDFDWDGDGVWREWQFSTHHGVLRHHLGTATRAPWRVTWDASWLPDQPQPIRVRARITDVAGITYLTPPVENLRQRRASRSVRMFVPADVPERFNARNGKESPKCSLVVDGDLARATAARLVVSTWSGSTDDDSIHELRLNGERLANRFGQFHHYSFNALEVPLSRLKRGANTVSAFSTYKGHMLEINWPGPVLLIAFDR